MAANFAVVDHANADAVRSVRRRCRAARRSRRRWPSPWRCPTRWRRLAATAAARLDSIFLDEGFGTLDPDTLDTVATTIEELGASGRMVGIVTHVRELAERVPVRFEVRKGPTHGHGRAGGVVTRAKCDLARVHHDP